MSVEIHRVTDPEYFESFDLTKGSTGKSGFVTHLKSIIYDCNIERAWNKPNNFIYSADDLGFIMFSITTQHRRHCTLRHVVVSDEARGKGLGKLLFYHMTEVMGDEGVNILRMFINPPALPFYSKLGFNDYHGKSKTGLDFYYGDLDGNLIKPLPKNQQRYVVQPETNTNITGFFTK